MSERFVNVESAYAEEVEFTTIDKATHLIHFEDEFSVEIDGFSFEDVQQYVKDGYQFCTAKESEKVIIEMDKKTAKQLMFLLGHFNSSNSSVFHPLLGAGVDGETLYDEMANVLGDIFESGEELPYKLKTAKSTFNDPVLTLTETDNE